MKDPIKVSVSPTLIIGLGGTGSLALQYVKRKIRKRLESYKSTGRDLPRAIPFIEFLVLDTTAQEEVLDDVFFPDEYLNIGRLNVSRIINHLEHDLDYTIQKWFPKELDPGQIDSGAGGVRAIGRLCFFINQSQIESTLRNKIGSIQDFATIKTFLNEHLPGLRIEEGSTVDVHIVSSLCGGTGSACLLDTSYLVKHLIDDGPKQETNSTAHLVTSEPFENEPGIGRSSREYIHTNFAVTLSEVEHFTQQDTPGRWDVEYRGGTRVKSKGKPFSVAYLMGCKEGVSLSKDHVCEIIGETIAIKTVHPEGRRIKGAIENYKPHVIDTKDINQKPRTYSSHNSRILNLGVDTDMLKSATRVASRTILTSLCEENVFPAAIEEAFKVYEQMFVEKMRIGISFPQFIKRLEEMLPVGPDKFSETLRIAKSALSLPDKKRKKESLSKANSVNMTAEAIEIEIREKEVGVENALNRSFDGLRKSTDEYINALLGSHSFEFTQTLLEQINKELGNFEDSFKEHMRSFPSPEYNYVGDLVAAIDNGSGQNIPTICSKRAKAKIHGSILASLARQLTDFRTELRRRIEWCREAQKCITAARKVFVEEKRAIPASRTTSYVWTQDALEQLIPEARSRFVKKFLTLLEQKHARNGDLNAQVSFLPHLNDSLLARREAEDLVHEAATGALREEIDANSETKRQEALRNMYQLVELASPPWQIERLGEDVASVAFTTCPLDSESGEIMSRSGKNITFSRNGHSNEEFILFRSEHGVSVNHLINFRRCLKAVSRKLQAAGKDRINDICLDPNWNIATPLQIEEDIEKLRLYFSLAICFQLLHPQASGYVFTTPSGSTVELGKHPDVTKTVKRFEAFDRLLDLDSEGSVESNQFVKMVEDEIEKRRTETHIETLRTDLSSYQDSLTQRLSRTSDVRDQRQLETELKGLQVFIEDLEKFLNETRPDQNGS